MNILMMSFHSMTHEHPTVLQPTKKTWTEVWRQSNWSLKVAGDGNSKLLTWLFVLHWWFNIKRSDYLTRSQGISDVSDFSILLCLLKHLDFFRGWVSSNIIHFSTRARPLCPLMQLRLGPLATAHRAAWEKQDAEAELHPEQSKGSMGSKVQCWLSGQFHRAQHLKGSFRFRSTWIQKKFITWSTPKWPNKCIQATSIKVLNLSEEWCCSSSWQKTYWSVSTVPLVTLNCFNASPAGPDVPRSPRSVWPTPAGDQRPEVGLCFTLLLYLFCEN